MNVALSGATGFIGQALVKRFSQLGWTVSAIDRNSLDLPDHEFSAAKTEHADVVINLAGAPVSRKWSLAYKKDILDSRVNTTRKISNAINNSLQKPTVFISASAVGIYDSTNTHTESSTALAGSFLADVCRNWEHEAQASDPVTRVVILRLGMVLGEEGGALKKMRVPFSLGLGGKLGDGNQAVSFIHISDLADAIIFIIEHATVRGIVNAVSPYPVSNAEFTSTLGKVFRQPAWFTVPGFALKMLYGEGAQVMLEGQRVLPEKLLEAGFSFRYPTISSALLQIYG